MTSTPTGTKEWAASNVNICLGCSHGCHYCYAKSMAIRFGRCKGPADWREEKLTASADRPIGKRQGTVMFPSTHDITPAIADACAKMLRRLLEAGNRVLAVSKPHIDVIDALTRDLAPWRDQLLWRFTIGAQTLEVLQLWEPGAPSFDERLASLDLANARGFATSVSMEPMLENPEWVIHAVKPFVTDSIWLGRMNNAGLILETNRAPAGVKLDARRLLDEQDKEWVRELYRYWTSYPGVMEIVRWKDSIKRIVGLARPTKAGLDI